MKRSSYVIYSLCIQTFYTLVATARVRRAGAAGPPEWGYEHWGGRSETLWVLWDPWDTLDQPLAHVRTGLLENSRSDD